MTPNRPQFSVNGYDRDGDMIDRGIFLHFGDVRIKAAESLEEFEAIVKHFENMVKEIHENYRMYL